MGRTEADREEDRASFLFHVMFMSTVKWLLLCSAGFWLLLALVLFWKLYPQGKVDVIIRWGEPAAAADRR
jgi:hypothetical protein